MALRDGIRTHVYRLVCRIIQNNWTMFDVDRAVDRIMIEVENYAEEKAGRENEKGDSQRELPLPQFKR